MRAGVHLAAGLLLAALAVPSAADAGWSRARSVHGASPVVAPALASNQRGDALLAWIDKRGVMVALAQGGGRFGRPQRVPGKLAGPGRPVQIRAAIDRSGMAVVGWSSCRPIEPQPACGAQVRAAVRLPGHGFSEATRISDAGKIAPLGEVGVRSGLAVVTYGQRKVGTRSATFVAHSAGKGFVRQRIARFSLAPGVVRARDGSERLFYLSAGGLQAVTRAASGRIGRPTELVGPEVRSYADAGGAAGEEALVWSTQDTGALEEGLLLPGRPLARRTLDTGFGNYEYAIDGAANGHFLTLFDNHLNGQGLHYSRRKPGSRGFSVAHELPGAGDGRAPDVSVRSDGTAAVAWSEPVLKRVHVGVLGSDGRMRDTTSFFVGDTGQAGPAVPKTSIDRSGRVWLIWHDEDHLRVAHLDR
jgi:hypothetical protein